MTALQFKPQPPSPTWLLWPFDAREHPGDLALRQLLVHGCLYELHGISLISDTEFDELVNVAAAVWDSFEHPHKSLVAINELVKTKSMHDVRFPLRVKQAANEVLRRRKENNG